MPTLPTVQDFYNAKDDADDLAEIVNGDALAIITTRYGGDKPSVQRAMELALLRYGTLNNRGAWQSTTPYAVNDIWQHTDNTWYLVVIGYTSSADIATDAASNNAVVYHVDNTALQEALEQIDAQYKQADVDIIRKASDSNPSPNLDLVKRGFDKASYVKIAMQDSTPTDSPNNRNEWVIDQVRQQLHVAMTDYYLPVSNVIDTRYFAIFTRGYILRFDNNASYTGDITLRVYPVQNGGDGLPNNPTLNNNEWQTYTTTVTNLFKIGTMDDGNYFTGIIDFVSLDTTGRWDRLDRDTCQFAGIKAFVDYQFSAEPQSIFTKFYLQTDGLWYGKDITPLTPAEIGASWVQSGTDYREYTVTDASDEADALQLFADDTLEYYTVNAVLVTSDLISTIAVTASNNANLTIYDDGPARFIFANTRLYLKRTNSNSGISAKINVESVKMVLPNE